jgi:hypothetical protein
LIIDFPLAIFSPQHTICESRTIIAWLKGGKNKDTGGKNIIYFPPVGFCALFSVTIKILGKKYDIMSPIASIFFQASHNFM